MFSQDLKLNCQKKKKELPENQIPVYGLKFNFSLESCISVLVVINDIKPRFLIDVLFFLNNFGLFPILLKESRFRWQSMHVCVW